MKIKSFIKTIADHTQSAPLSATSIITKECTILAGPGNTGYVFIGDSTGQVFPITAGKNFRVADLAYTRTSPKQEKGFIDLKDVYIKVEVDGEGVYVAYTDRS